MEAVYAKARSWCAGRGLAEEEVDIYLRHATWLSSSPASSGRVQVAFLGWGSVRVQGTENYFEDFCAYCPHPILESKNGSSKE